MLPKALPHSRVMLGCPMRRGPENRVFRCPYRLENKVETTTVLLVERGAQTMSLPISLVSNSTIEQQDFDAWAGECRRDGTNITSLSEAEEAASRIKRAHSYAQLPQSRENPWSCTGPAGLINHGVCSAAAAGSSSAWGSSAWQEAVTRLVGLQSGHSRT